MTAGTSVSARPSQGRIYAVILIGTLAVSFAAIFIRMAQAEGMPSLAIAGGRLLLSALILTPFALARHQSELRRLSRADIAMAAAAGMLLAVHFATWIASLEYTSVLISVVFVTTSPLWVALLEVVFLRARLRGAVWAGLAIALIGGITIGLSGDSSSGTGSNPVLGGALALAGAVAIAFYLIIGRRLRAKLTLLPYVWLVYGFGALFLMLLLLVTATPLVGYSPTAYLWVLVLAVVPQIVGHSALNYALRYLPATFISIATQLEPIGSAVAAFVFFRELPQPLQIVGSVAILVGVFIATMGQASET